MHNRFLGSCADGVAREHWRILGIPRFFSSIRIARQIDRCDEASPADVIIVMGAAEYRGRPSPVLRARLDHAVALYRGSTWRRSS